MSSSTPSSNISPKGTIQNLLSLGFTPMDALKDILDGSCDARAPGVRTSLFDDRLVIADDGHGMTLEELRAALCINDTKPASANIGTKGAGYKAAMAAISRLETKPLIFSKKSGHETVNVEVDFPKCITDDVWCPMPSELSVRNAPLWESVKMPGDHGTVTVIPLPTRCTFPAIQTILSDLGVTYENYIRGGMRFTVVVNGEERVPDMSMALAYEDTPPDMRDETHIHILTSPDGLEERVYWRHSCLSPAWTDWVRENPDDPYAGPTKLPRDYADSIAAGFTVNTLCYRQVYNSEWNTPGVAVIPGYTALRRGKRVLRTIPTKPATKGDMFTRKVFDSARGSIDFSHHEDKYFSIQIDKSAVNLDSIHKGLLHAMTRIKSRWISELIKRIGAPAPVARAPEDFTTRLNRAVKLLKTTAKGDPTFLDAFEDLKSRFSDETFREMFDEMIAEYDNPPDDESDDE
jgi:hypothetical protein